MLKNFVIDKNGKLLKYNGKGNMVFIPEGVTALCKNTFEYNSNIQKLILPSSLNYVEAGALSNNRALKEIAVDKYNENFKSNDGKSLLSKDGKTLYAFIPNYLGEYVISKEVETIGPKAFTDANVNKVIIGENVKTISEASFAWCKNLEAVEFDKNSKLEFVGSEAFWYCQNLKNIKIPTEYLKHVGENMFYGDKIELNDVFPQGSLYNTPNGWQITPKSLLK